MQDYPKIEPLMLNFWVVLHGNGEDIYFLISPTLPISPSPHTSGASFTITMHHHQFLNLFDLKAGTFFDLTRLKSLSVKALIFNQQPLYWI